MYNLIAKDLRLQKMMIFIYIALMIGFLLLGYGFVFTVVALAVNYVINVHFLDNKDESNNGYKFMHSLPYSRQQVISSKYISILLVTAAMCVITIVFQLLINTLLPSLAVDLPTYTEVGVSFIIVQIFAAIYLPTFYTFRNKYLLSGFSLLVMVVLLLWWKIDEWLNISNYLYKLLIEFSIIEITTYAFIIAVLLYTASYLLTVRIYRRIDF